MEKSKETTGASRAVARAEELGMTLIEIMIVLAILALVMGFLVGPRILASFKQAKVKTAKLEIKDIAYQAFPRWSSDNEDSDCPASLEELKKYANKKSFKDPWGSKYIMRCGDGLPEGVDFGILSLGPDKKEGTDDDIRSWDEK